MDRKHNKELTACAKNLRKNMTAEEKKLWYEFLRTYSVRFLRQKVIDSYIVDFYCHDAKLIVEIDGSQHYSEEGLQKDKTRTEVMELRGLKLIRFTNTDIRMRFAAVCESIDTEVKKRLESPSQPAADSPL